MITSCIVHCESPATYSARRPTRSERCIMTSGKLKLLSAALSVAALIATPALASTAHKARVKGSDAYASKPQPQPQQAHELYGWEGQLLGTDPDPNIRFQLQRDQNLGGN